MDFAVIFASFISLFLFVFIHFLVFRSIDKHSVIRGLLFTFVGGNIISLIFISIFLFLLNQTIGVYFVLLLISFILFNLLAASYILGFFGMMVASLRVRILREIYIAGSNGINKKSIIEKYNERMIVDERLKRLLKSGEVKVQGDIYNLVNRFSIFRLHHSLFMIFKKLYT